MFKKRKLEVRLVADDASSDIPTNPEEPKLTPFDYALITEEAAMRMGKKLIVGIVVTLATVAVINVLANAADTALQNSITSD